MIALGLDRVESGLKGCMVWLSKFIVGEVGAEILLPIHPSFEKRLSAFVGAWG